MENHSTQTSCTNDLQSTKTTWKDIFLCPLVYFYFPHVRHLLLIVVRYSCSFVPVFFSPHYAALFLESQFFLLLLIYIIFSSENKPLKTKTNKKILHSSGAFVGMFMSSCLKLQMPSNMHGTSENTRKTGYEIFWSATWPFLSKPTLTQRKAARGVAVWIWWCWFSNCAPVLWVQLVYNRRMIRFRSLFFLICTAS